MRTVDLFAGCGGFSLGFQQAGFDIVAAFDNWQPAIDIYRDNFTHPIFNQDLGNPEGYRSIADFAPELIIGGPPCQDFSSAGKRNENLGRANLTRAFADIVCLVQPTWFVMENVSLITRSPILATVLEKFKNSGYGLRSTIINASYCGVPQSRKRYFLIGKLGEMNENMDNILSKNQSIDPMTIFDYLGNSLELEYYYRHPRSYQRRGIFSIHEPSPTVRGVNRPIPKTYQKHLVKHENQQRIETLLAGVKRLAGAIPLSSESIVSIVQSHLVGRNSSRLPVLIVTAAYKTVSAQLGEQAKVLASHNAADKQTGAIGDVEITLIDDDRVLTGYEMKMRPVTREDVDP